MYRPKQRQISRVRVKSQSLSLGLHINADFGWSTQIDQLSIEIKKRIGLLRRIKKRVPKEKNIIIAEAILNTLGPR